jgi:hypothetical protein
VKDLSRLPEPYRSVWLAAKAMFCEVDLAVAGLVEPPLTYDPVHRCFRRLDEWHVEVP